MLRVARPLLFFARSGSDVKHRVGKFMCSSFVQRRTRSRLGSVLAKCHGTTLAGAILFPQPSTERFPSPVTNDLYRELRKGQGGEMRESSHNSFSASDPCSGSGRPGAILSPYSRRFYPQILAAQYFGRIHATPRPQTVSHEYFTDNDKKILRDTQDSLSGWAGGYYVDRARFKT